MGMSTGGGKDGLNSDINVTPLVDVMLVLLVIFMITAPMLNAAVDLDLPEGEATTIEDPEGLLILSIDRNRRLFLGDTAVPWVGLEDKLATNERVKRERQLYIQADKHLPYGVVVQAMAMAKRAGVVKVMMVTNPNEDPPPLAEWDQATTQAGGPAPAPTSTPMGAATRP
jgi:biopolymer transport protein TolR